MTVPRHVGSRSGLYSLIVCTDASNLACGSVLYIMDVESRSLSFYGACSKLLSEDLRKKSIPSLELLGIAWGLQYMFDKYESLASRNVINPIQIVSLYLYTDSTCCLHWLESYGYKFEKLNSKSTFVKNKLRQIDRLCSKKTVKFVHTKGVQNPADATTRPYSYNTLMKNNSNFLHGPQLVQGLEEDVYITDRVITLPNPGVFSVDEVIGSWGCDTEQAAEGDLVRQHDKTIKRSTSAVIHPLDTSKYSKFSFLVTTLKIILLFLNKLKNKTKGQNLLCLSSRESIYRQAKMMIIRVDQEVHFEREFNFLSARQPCKEIPPIITKMNLYVDAQGILRLKSKMGKHGYKYTPILLPRKSTVTETIINQTHIDYGHCGSYQLAGLLKKEYYVTGIMSLVKKILRRCTVCRRFYARPIKLNQNDYRLERVDPEKQPFANLYLDYAGPFIVELCSNKIKVWLLVLTCMWSRAVNVIVCRSADTASFLKALQKHIYSYGLFKTCISDLGSQIRAGASIITAYLGDSDTQSFLDVNNVRWMKFRHFAKGNSALGSLVEICVKQVKLLIYKTVKRVILEYFQFEHLVSKCVMLINKRPVAFKSTLATLEIDETPQPITPEMLIRGYETNVLDIIPAQEAVVSDSEEDFESLLPTTDALVDQYEKLKAAKGRMVNYYHREFLNTLIEQAVDKKDRYKAVKHENLKPGDIVLLVEPNAKRLMYPLGKIEKVEINELGETTAVYVFKGATRESVYRHATSIILLLSKVNGTQEKASVSQAKDALSTKENHRSCRPQRKAALECREKIKTVLGHLQ